MGYAADHNVDEVAENEVIAMKYCVDVASRLEPMWLEQSHIVPSQSIPFDEHCSNHVPDIRETSKSAYIGCTLIDHEMLEEVAELSPLPP